ncbi:hypothetical protein BKA65DRAFT_574427 [Rhexocercosporidium sp. MPI-PUGE-AT-0058]|nr:hypothetical protein BKA65DRAFT_574427 [Rhexocercosporidium sp. MPI-PUGE-AT-0058]
MPLTAQSPLYLHFLQNVLLIALATFLAPLCTLIAISTWIISPYTKMAQQIRSGFTPYSSSHGRRNELGATAYIGSLVEVIQKENVDLWISCSGVASALEDGKVAEAVEKLTSCRVVQFGVEMTGVLHEKHSFIDNTRRIGLNAPETQSITCIEEGVEFLHPKSAKTDTQYIMKSVGMDDSIRADMSLLPFSHAEKTKAHLATLRPSPSRPFVLQQYIKGPEYCTHSIVIRGCVLAFTCCPSAELLMHYKALPPSSSIFKALLKYTQIYAQKMGTEMTGHFSIDFLLDHESAEEDLMNKIYPIECNPRAHTAVILFADQGLQMAEAYLRVLQKEKKSSGYPDIVIPMSTPGYYWVGHDLVAKFIVPAASFLALRIQFSELRRNWMEFFEHAKRWRDGTYETWDPWPFWALYCIYWPGIFFTRICTRRKWSMTADITAFKSEDIGIL